MTQRETHTVKIAGLTRHLPLFQVAPGVKIAIFNMLGDTEVIEAAAKALAKRLPKDAQVLITAEAKGIPLAHALSVESKLPYVVLRKSYKPYMGETVSAETLSITTGQPQTWFVQRVALALADVLALLVVWTPATTFPVGVQQPLCTSSVFMAQNIFAGLINATFG